MAMWSTGTELGGQQDAVGFASRADQMARVWEVSTTGPEPDVTGVARAPDGSAEHDNLVEHAAPVGDLR